MKRTINIILAVLALSLSIHAQDSRQRLTSTIVGDVLAAMPAQTAAEFSSDMKDIAASAPESISILAGMLQSADKGVNNKVEYAISGVVNYVASEGASYKGAVKEGLQTAIKKVDDPVNRQFLEQQLRFLSPESEPSYEEPELSAAELEAKVKTDLKSGQRNLMCEALYIQAEKLGTFDSKALLEALKSDDRSYRTMALQYASEFADESLYAKVGKKFKSLGEGAKEDVLNWLGDTKVTSQLPLVLSALKDTKSTSGIKAAAIEAAGKIGGSDAADALISELGTDQTPAAKRALLSIKDDISGKVQEALDDAEGTKLENLLSIAAAKRMSGCTDKVLELCLEGNPDARAALEKTVTPDYAPKMARLADKAQTAEDIDCYTKAFNGAISTLPASEQYARARYAMDGATNKARFYGALAQSGTDEAAADLVKAYDGADKEAALAALCAIDNKGACETLLEAGKAGNMEALTSYVDKSSKFLTNADRKCSAFTQALSAATDAKTKSSVLKKLATTPTAAAFKAATESMEDKDVAIDAAYATKNIAAKCVDDLPYESKVASLEQAKAIIAARGTADDGYAVDEITKLISETEEPLPVAELTDEEKAAGYEMLFDGTSLDKWTGNKTSYQIVNNTLYVTAAYGADGNLYTAKEYRDFVYRFEFCFVRPGVNNGVGIRTPMGVDAAYDGMCEVQILDHDDPVYAGWLKEYQVHGSVYGVIPAKRIVHKPLGEWSTEEIRVQGNHITVTVNGEVIVDGDISEACQGHNIAPDGADSNPYTVDHRNHPGMFNETGHIGFLGHGAGVKFRNVRVLDLSPAKAKKR